MRCFNECPSRGLFCCVFSLSCIAEMAQSTTRSSARTHPGAVCPVWDREERKGLDYFANLMEKPYIFFLGDVKDDLSAKTSRGIADWRPEQCVGEHRLPGCGTTLGLEELGFEEAVARGAKTLVLGVANAGGVIDENWVPGLVDAVEAGLDVASGLHQRLTDIPELREAAKKHGRALYDVRHPVVPLTVGTGEKRTGKRLLTVGTDCSVGKMYTTLALDKEMRQRKFRVDFRATGQTGIFIAGEGISVDAVVADFISGAVETLSPANDPDHWDLIEGQGSLFHPSFAGVSLGLLHGAQPDALVLCHEPNRPFMRGLPRRSLPEIQACLNANLEAARLTNPNVRAVGISFNTAKMEKAAALELMNRTEKQLGLPCVDPMVTSVAPIVERLAEP